MSRPWPATDNDGVGPRVDLGSFLWFELTGGLASTMLRVELTAPCPPERPRFALK